MSTRCANMLCFTLVSWRLRAAVLLSCILPLLLAFGVGVAAAGDAEKLNATGVKIAGDASRVRVVVNFDREPELRWFLLRGPHRLVIDLPETTFRIGEKESQPRGMVTDLRFGNLESGASRMILSLDGPFEVERLDVLQNEDGKGGRIVADIVAATPERFEAALADQIAATGTTEVASKADRLGMAATEAPRRFSIVIDAGHGGIDTGAESAAGTKEKTITLAFALELAAALESTGRYDVHLTRDSDVFLRLDERVRIARQYGADLFVSVHADAIRHKDLRGATVYTVSDRASDEAAAAKAIRENLADEMAGIQVKEEKDQVADILADLVRRETQSFSIRFARSLVGELSDRILMINNPHRFAGFRVLKAPDVPSVLVELGYLSNVEDEKLLRDPDWRAKAAGSIIAAVDRFADAKIGAGG